MVMIKSIFKTGMSLTALILSLGHSSGANANWYDGYWTQGAGELPRTYMGNYECGGATWTLYMYIQQKVSTAVLLKPVHTIELWSASILSIYDPNFGALPSG